MKLSDARDHYYTFSGKVSDVARQLCFAGIAVIWIFAVGDSVSGFSLPAELIWPLTFFILGLAFDLLHYLIAAASWGIFHRVKEKQHIGEDTDFGAPAYINYAPLTFFWGKAIATLVGYGQLLSAIAS